MQLTAPIPAKAFCTLCGTNWSHLCSLEEEGDEEYEFCPLCLTAEHLVEGREGASYSFHPITGEKIDNETGKVVAPPSVPPPPIPDNRNPSFSNRYKKIL